MTMMNVTGCGVMMSQTRLHCLSSHIIALFVSVRAQSTHLHFYRPSLSLWICDVVCARDAAGDVDWSVVRWTASAPSQQITSAAAAAAAARGNSNATSPSNSLPVFVAVDRGRAASALNPDIISPLRIASVQLKQFG